MNIWNLDLVYLGYIFTYKCNDKPSPFRDIYMIYRYSETKCTLFVDDDKFLLSLSFRLLLFVLFQACFCPDGVIYFFLTSLVTYLSSCSAWFLCLVHCHQFIMGCPERKTWSRHGGSGGKTDGSCWQEHRLSALQYQLSTWHTCTNF